MFNEFVYCFKPFSLWNISKNCTKMYCSMKQVDKLHSGNETEGLWLPKASLSTMSLSLTAPSLPLEKKLANPCFIAFYPLTHKIINLYYYWQNICVVFMLGLLWIKPSWAFLYLSHEVHIVGCRFRWVSITFVNNAKKFL